ncbi:MAG: ribosome maturation factor RimP [Nitrosomonadaceae bacterium]|nr:ribosome maturation factor RimP [Nitrosospira sp.]MDW7565426.1 ribosome maturation factor RimP [Nitrosomonadaceae bacterium]MBA0917107.1 ribosome maturation factor RimP [Nitrosospira sp.]MBI0409045.1 ribosome maturation factor RimP [Nitrosospira sp.]MBI0410841.1 ribosome maturation factor RimP [Nitrosospira sp.]
MELHELLELTLSGMGYELVDVERSPRGKLLRVFIDKPNGITVEDCAAISNHLDRLFTVENVDYDRLEISSPGMDRPLKRASDFARFTGELAKLKLRVALQGQRNFIGILRGVSDEVLKLEVDGAMLDIELGNLEKARLVPKL